MENNEIYRKRLIKEIGYLIHKTYKSDEYKKIILESLEGSSLDQVKTLRNNLQRKKLERSLIVK
jgi:hypothetical protein